MLLSYDQDTHVRSLIKNELSIEIIILLIC